MPTLRRILKYTPAALLGLLALAWVATQGGWIQFCFREYVVVLTAGNVAGYWQESEENGFLWAFQPEWLAESPLGRVRGVQFFGVTNYGLSIPFLCTIVLPLAIGPFISFRFRLWHYLAYTALIALELAYYLRWQE